MRGLTKPTFERNPGLPGFSRFWGWRFTGLGLEGQFGRYRFLGTATLNFPIGKFLSESKTDRRLLVAYQKLSYRKVIRQSLRNEEGTMQPPE